MPEIDPNEGEISFFHGTDYSSAQNIVSNGLSAETGRNFGGDGSFWAIIASSGRESNAASIARFGIFQNRRKDIERSADISVEKG